MQSVLLLGRQPALGLAELESLYGAAVVQQLGDQAALVDVDPCLLAFDRLGGSQKFCKLLTTLDTTNWGKIEKFLIQVSPTQSQTMPEGKMQLGLSAIGFDTTPERLMATGLSLKKAIRKTGRSVRLIPNKTLELGSAQVIHNHLTGPNGWELVCIAAGGKTYITQTVKVQDIEAYTHRDRERPKRDAKVGMLPPKLAQIIINLAAGPLPQDKLESICDIPAGEPIPQKILNQTLLDPFCGTGVVLQEALLMGYEALGADIDQRMVDYSIANIFDWLVPQYDGLPGAGVAVGDATTTTWETSVISERDAKRVPADIDLVACETYLGRAFTAQPSAEILAQTVSDCNLIIKKFLRNAHRQLKPGTRLCIAVPAWQTRPDQFKHLSLLDSLEEIGYNRIDFEHVERSRLIYYRTDQIVARELVVLTTR